MKSTNTIRKDWKSFSVILYKVPRSGSLGVLFPWKSCNELGSVSSEIRTQKCGNFRSQMKFFRFIRISEAKSLPPLHPPSPPGKVVKCRFLLWLQIMCIEMKHIQREKRTFCCFYLSSLSVGFSTFILGIKLKVIYYLRLVGNHC